MKICPFELVKNIKFVGYITDVIAVQYPVSKRVFNADHTQTELAGCYKIMQRRKHTAYYFKTSMKVKSNVWATRPIGRR